LRIECPTKFIPSTDPVCLSLPESMLLDR